MGQQCDVAIETDNLTTGGMKEVIKFPPYCATIRQQPALCEQSGQGASRVSLMSRSVFKWGNEHNEGTANRVI